MESPRAVAVPGGHTPDGGVLVGSDGARHRLVLFEDPQCPYCRQFEEVSADVLQGEVAAGAVAVEYRMRCFLGVESVRADNALALAAESGRFDQLRRELFANQPAESSGGFTVTDLIDLGRQAGLTAPGYRARCSRGALRAMGARGRARFRGARPAGDPLCLVRWAGGCLAGVVRPGGVSSVDTTLEQICSTLDIAHPRASTSHAVRLISARTGRLATLEA